MSRAIAILAAFSIAGVAAPAFASSDYLLQIPTGKGEASPSITVDSWSFGVCNAGQCSQIVSPRDAASGLPTGKTGRPGASYDLATNKGGRTAAQGVNVAVGDLDGDGRADLAFVATQGEVASLSLNFSKITYSYRQACDGRHLDKVILSNPGGDEFVVTGATISCTPSEVAKNAPARDFCTKSGCVDLGPTTITFTGGQMKHTKTGHVTLLK